MMRLFQLEVLFEVDTHRKRQILERFHLAVEALQSILHLSYTT